MLGYECAGFWPARSEGERYLVIGVCLDADEGAKGRSRREDGEAQITGQ